MNYIIREIELCELTNEPLNCDPLKVKKFFNDSVMIHACYRWTGFLGTCNDGGRKQ